MKTHCEISHTIWTTQIQDLTPEDLMEIIRSVNNPWESTRKPKQEPPSSPRKSVDVYCDTCSSHGHRWRDCNFLAKTIKALDFLSNLDTNKRKTLLDTFHKEQTRKRQTKQSTAIVRASTYIENKDIKSMYVLIQELHPEDAEKHKKHTVEEEEDLEWQQKQVQANNTPPPEPAPDWDTTDLIRTVANGGGLSNNAKSLTIHLTRNLQCILDLRLITTPQMRPQRHYLSDTTHRPHHLDFKTLQQSLYGCK